MSAGCVFELAEHTLKPGFEAAFFGRSELFRDAKAGEAYEGLVDVIKPPFEHGGGGRGPWIGGWLSPHQPQGRPDELAPVRLVGHTVSCEQSESLAGLEAMALCGTKDGILFFCRQGAQRVGQRGTDNGPCKFVLGRRR
jgi:hypothetical protein|tara:strand:+ start:167 stop:583 length:417 start_codon:yes stop_codon:yes gene_type:complete